MNTMSRCDCLTYCKGWLPETGTCQGLPVPEALRGPQAVTGPQSIPDYPSRSFAGADGSRSVPWDDWVDMRRRAMDLAETVERLLNDPVRKELAEAKRRLAAADARVGHCPTCEAHASGELERDDVDCVWCRIGYLAAQESLLQEWQDRAEKAEAHAAEVLRPLDEQMARLNARVTELNGENARLLRELGRAVERPLNERQQERFFPVQHGGDLIAAVQNWRASRVEPPKMARPFHTPYNAERLLSFRQAHCLGDHDEAWHQIYSMVAENCADPYNPWTELEKLSPTPDVPPEEHHP